MRLRLTTTFPAPADHVWALVRKSSTLLFVCRGLLGFRRAEDFPQQWRNGDTEVARLLFFGCIPAWKHSLTFERIDDDARILSTREGGGLVPVWDHIIRVTPNGNQACTYLDEVEIKAGVLTFVMWLYAQTFYRYRQLRWRTLLRKVPQNATSN
ncbi:MULTISPECIES: hypothetical protein [Marinobacter]|uniref:hypothetical protein n=1 Tax=Marinobacter TaxID=2742 RepID=UPI00125F92D3|nr:MULTISPECIES: hypothetical protein [Marinobacter]MDC8454760.1 hypothetical protein [Marinobacter sp. DS40M6]